MDSEAYRANRGDRCYHCKKALFTNLQGIRLERQLAVLVDGSNRDDLGDDRPGRRAALEAGVRSPLMELGLGKQQVRAAARALGLPQWDKPAMACLASRVPVGTAVTTAALLCIGSAEELLHGLGFRQYRVRDEHPTARTELLPEEMERALSLRQEIVAVFVSLGYGRVALDLAGYGQRGIQQQIKDSQ